MIRPERRTKNDLAAVALILVAVLAGSITLWLTSDVRATESETAESVTTPPPARSVPRSMAEAWRAPSPVTPQPVVAGPSVVTGAGKEVSGRDPRTGDARWHYSRDIPLCTVGSAWESAIAVYRKSTNCSEVTALEGATGKRGPQRNTDARYGTQLLRDGDYVTTSGDMVETWRSDLVRTQQYGVPRNLRNPANNLPRPECRRTSVGVGEERIGLIEECPDEASDRLTVLKADPEDDEEPEEVFSTLVDSAEANVVAVNEDRAAIVLRDLSMLVRYNADGSVLSRTHLKETPGGVGDGVEPAAPDGLRTVLVDARTAGDIRSTAETLVETLRPVVPSISTDSVLAATERAPGRAVPVASLRESDVDELKSDPGDMPGVSSQGVRYWHTGSDTVALDADRLTPLWTEAGTMGPGTLFGGELVLPVPEGLAVVDPRTGDRQRVLPIDRKGFTGPVRLDSLGDTIIEQRGDTLVALR